MWRSSKHLDRGQFREFDRRGPVLVVEGTDVDLTPLVEDYRSFGGTLRALLIPRHKDGREVVEVEVDYASWKMTVGTLPESLTREFYRPLRKMERHGMVAMCVASIETAKSRRPAPSSEFAIWLNPAA